MATARSRMAACVLLAAVVLTMWVPDLAAAAGPGLIEDGLPMLELFRMRRDGALVTPRPDVRYPPGDDGAPPNRLAAPRYYAHSVAVRLNVSAVAQPVVVAPEPTKPMRVSRLKASATTTTTTVPPFLEEYQKDDHGRLLVEEIVMARFMGLAAEAAPAGSSASGNSGVLQLVSLVNGAALAQAEVLTCARAGGDGSTSLGFRFLHVAYVEGNDSAMEPRVVLGCETELHVFAVTVGVEESVGDNSTTGSGSPEFAVVYGLVRRATVAYGDAVVAVATSAASTAGVSVAAQLEAGATGNVSESAMPYPMATTAANPVKRSDAGTVVSASLEVVSAALAPSAAVMVVSVSRGGEAGAMLFDAAAEVFVGDAAATEAAFLACPGGSKLAGVVAVPWFATYAAMNAAAGTTEGDVEGEEGLVVTCTATTVYAVQLKRLASGEGGYALKVQRFDNAERLPEAERRNTVVSSAHVDPVEGAARVEQDVYVALVWSAAGETQVAVLSWRALFPADASEVADNAAALLWHTKEALLEGLAVDAVAARGALCETGSGEVAMARAPLATVVASAPAYLVLASTADAVVVSMRTGAVAWQLARDAGSLGSEVRVRPQLLLMPYSNTTRVNATAAAEGAREAALTALSDRFGFLLSNETMVMAHWLCAAAAGEPENSTNATAEASMWALEAAHVSLAARRLGYLVQVPFYYAASVPLVQGLVPLWRRDAVSMVAGVRDDAAGRAGVSVVQHGVALLTQFTLVVLDAEDGEARAFFADEDRAPAIGPLQVVVPAAATGDTLIGVVGASSDSDGQAVYRTTMDGVALYSTTQEVTHGYSLTFGWRRYQLHEMTVQNGVVYATTSEGGLVAVDRTGREVWHAAAPFKTLNGRLLPFAANYVVALVVGGSGLAVYDSLTGALVDVLLVPAGCEADGADGGVAVDRIAVDPEASGSQRSAFFTTGGSCLFLLTDALELHVAPLPFEADYAPYVDAVNELVYLRTSQTLRTLYAVNVSSLPWAAVRGDAPAADGGARGASSRRWAVRRVAAGDVAVMRVFWSLHRITAVVLSSWHAAVSVNGTGEARVWTKQASPLVYVATAEGVTCVSAWGRPAAETNSSGTGSDADHSAVADPYLVWQAPVGGSVRSMEWFNNSLYTVSHDGVCRLTLLPEMPSAWRSMWCSLAPSVRSVSATTPVSLAFTREEGLLLVGVGSSIFMLSAATGMAPAKRGNPLNVLLVQVPERVNQLVVDDDHGVVLATGFGGVYAYDLFGSDGALLFKLVGLSLEGASLQTSYSGFTVYVETQLSSLTAYTVPRYVSQRHTVHFGFTRNATAPTGAPVEITLAPGFEAVTAVPAAVGDYPVTTLYPDAPVLAQQFAAVDVSGARGASVLAPTSLRLPRLLFTTPQVYARESVLETGTGTAGSALERGACYVAAYNVADWSAFEAGGTGDSAQLAPLWRVELDTVDQLPRCFCERAAAVVVSAVEAGMLASAACTSPTASGAVYVAQCGGRLLAFDAVSGTALWTLGAGEGATETVEMVTFVEALDSCPVKTDPSKDMELPASLILAVVKVGSEAAQFVVALEPLTGREVWRVRVDVGEVAQTYVVHHFTNSGEPTLLLFGHGVQALGASSGEAMYTLNAASNSADGYVGTCSSAERVVAGAVNIASSTVGNYNAGPHGHYRELDETYFVCALDTQAAANAGSDPALVIMSLTVRTGVVVEKHRRNALAGEPAGTVTSSVRNMLLLTDESVVTDESELQVPRTQVRMLLVSWRLSTFSFTPSTGTSGFNLIADVHAAMGVLEQTLYYLSRDAVATGEDEAARGARCYLRAMNMNTLVVRWSSVVGCVEAAAYELNEQLVLQLQRAVDMDPVLLVGSRGVYALAANSGEVLYATRGFGGAGGGLGAGTEGGVGALLVQDVGAYFTAGNGAGPILAVTAAVAHATVNAAPLAYTVLVPLQTAAWVRPAALAAAATAGGGAEAVLHSAVTARTAAVATGGAVGWRVQEVDVRLTAAAAAGALRGVFVGTVGSAVVGISVGRDFIAVHAAADAEAAAGAPGVRVAMFLKEDACHSADGGAVGGFAYPFFLRQVQPSVFLLLDETCVYRLSHADGGGNDDGATGGGRQNGWLLEGVDATQQLPPGDRLVTGLKAVAAATYERDDVASLDPRVTADGGVAYVSTARGLVVAVDVTALEVLWTSAALPPDGAVVGLMLSPSGAVAAPEALKVVVVTSAYVAALRGSSGEQLWVMRYPAEAPFASAPGGAVDSVVVAAALSAADESVLILLRKPDAVAKVTLAGDGSGASVTWTNSECVDVRAAKVVPPVGPMFPVSALHAVAGTATVLVAHSTLACAVDGASGATLWQRKHPFASTWNGCQRVSSVPVGATAEAPAASVLVQCGGVSYTLEASTGRAWTALSSDTHMAAVANNDAVALADRGADGVWFLRLARSGYAFYQPLVQPRHAAAAAAVVPQRTSKAAVAAVPVRVSAEPVGVAAAAEASVSVSASATPSVSVSSATPPPSPMVLPEGVVLPQLPCVLNVQQSVVQLVKCVDVALIQTYSNAYGPNEVHCAQSAAEFMGPCVDEWLRNVADTCLGSIIYLDTLLNEHLGTSEAYNFCHEPRRCLDGAKPGADAVCQLLARARYFNPNNETQYPKFTFPPPAQPFPTFAIPDVTYATRPARSSKLSGGQIAGIVVGVLLFVALLVLIVGVFVWWQRQQKAEGGDAGMDDRKARHVEEPHAVLVNAMSYGDGKMSYERDVSRASEAGAMPRHPGLPDYGEYGGDAGAPGTAGRFPLLQDQSFGTQPLLSAFGQGYPGAAGSGDHAGGYPGSAMALQSYYLPPEPSDTELTAMSMPNAGRGRAGEMDLSGPAGSANAGVLADFSPRD